jgi:hypothetical protein
VAPFCFRSIGWCYSGWGLWQSRVCSQYQCCIHFTSFLCLCIQSHCCHKLVLQCYGPGRLPLTPEVPQYMHRHTTHPSQGISPRGRWWSKQSTVFCIGGGNPRELDNWPASLSAFKSCLSVNHPVWGRKLWKSWPFYTARAPCCLNFSVGLPQTLLSTTAFCGHLPPRDYGRMSAGSLFLTFRSPEELSHKQ